MDYVFKGKSSIPAPVAIAVARDDRLIVIAVEQIQENRHVLIILTADLVTVDAIQVNILFTIGDLVPEVHLAVGRAKGILVAEHSFDWDLFAHVLHVEVLRVSDQRPQARILLELSVKKVLSQMLNVLDAKLSNAIRIFRVTGDIDIGKCLA